MHRYLRARSEASIVLTPSAGSLVEDRETARNLDGLMAFSKVDVVGRRRIRKKLRAGHWTRSIFSGMGSSDPEG